MDGQRKGLTHMSDNKYIYKITSNTKTGGQFYVVAHNIYEATRMAIDGITEDDWGDGYTIEMVSVVFAESTED